MPTTVPAAESPVPERRVLLTVSGTINPTVADDVAGGRRPRVDYVEMAAKFGADLIDYAGASTRHGRVGRLVERLLGRDVGLALSCFTMRRRYDIVMTDGEQIGLPLAAMLRLSGRRRPRHIMIVHILSVPKKVWMYRVLRLGRRIDEMIVYATSQRRFIVERLGYPADRVTVSPFMVDTAFFSPESVSPTSTNTSAADELPVVVAAGLEYRDYPTMLAAVRDLPARVVLAAASPWSKRASQLDGVELPSNVEVVRLDLHALRQLYADAAVVVMPLVESDFQAGVTALLEAMAMGKAIVCSATTGQTDVIEGDVTGLYVPVGDVAAMRSAIGELIVDPSRRDAIGRAAREWVVGAADIDVYVGGLAARVDAHRAMIRSA